MPGLTTGYIDFTESVPELAHAVRVAVVAEQEFVRGALTRVAPVFAPSLQVVAAISWWSPHARERWLTNVDAAIVDLDASDSSWPMRSIRDLLDAGVCVVALESASSVEAGALVRAAPRCAVLAKAMHTPQSIMSSVAQMAGATVDASSVAVSLSGAQEKVMRLFASGLSHAQIADQLGISPDTVKTHLKRIREKFRAHDVHLLTRADIYRVAGQRGLLGVG